MCSDGRKTIVVDRKEPEGKSTAIIGVGPPSNAVNSSVVPNEFAAEPTSTASPRRQV